MQPTSFPDSFGPPVSAAYAAMLLQTKVQTQRALEAVKYSDRISRESVLLVERSERLLAKLSAIQ